MPFPGPSSPSSLFIQSIPKVPLIATLTQTTGTAAVEETPAEEPTHKGHEVQVETDTVNAAAAHTMYHSWSPGHCPFTLPTPVMPPSEEYAPVEKFVSGVVDYLHAPSGAHGTRRSQDYRAVLTVLRTREDPHMLVKIFLALRMAGHGNVLRLLASNSHKFDSILHLVFAVDPFIPPDTLVESIVKEIQEKDATISPKRSKSATPAPPIIIDSKLLEQDVRLKPYASYQVADAHFHLLVALVSANSVYVTPAVSALWRMATHGLSDCPMERITRVHAALSTILRICPKAQSELFPALASNFPFKLSPAPQQLWYVHQCLTVVKYTPQIHKDVMELLIDRCLEIDIEIKIENGGDVKIEEAEDEEEGSADVDETDIFGLELDTPKKKTKEEEAKEIVCGEKTVDGMADKLDMLMLLLFQHVTVASKAQDNGEFARKLFHMIMPVFDSTIITTHRSKYVQFVIFLLCGLDYERSQANAAAIDDHTLYRVFTAKLIETLLDPFRATTMRQSGACYLASFLSRSTYVCIDTVCESLAALLSWTEAYMLTFPTEQSTIVAFRGKDTRNQCETHSLFYTVCQAAFYIMCFRGGDAVKCYRRAVKNHIANHDGIDVEGIDIGPERWSRLCNHHLNPLRYCLESVRGEFLHVANVLSLLEPTLLKSLCKEDKEMSTGAKRLKMARSKSIMTPALMANKRAKGGVGGLGRGSNPLDSFFPFDPYLLRRSHIFIEAYYRNWGGSIEEMTALHDDDIFADGAHADDSLDVEEDGYKSGDSSVSNSSKDSSSSKGSDTREDRLATSPDHQAMSLASVASGMAMSFSERANKHKDQPPRNSEVSKKKDEQRKTWTKSLERSRAHSVGSGSW